MNMKRFSKNFTEFLLNKYIFSAIYHLYFEIYKHFQLSMSADPKIKDKDQDDQVDEDYDPETEVVGNWKLCDLPEIPVVTGQEQEETIVKYRSKVYRWRGEWKERGVGELKLLKNKKSGLIRILVRAEKTHKCIVNHLLQQKLIFCKLEQLKTSNNSWTWAAYDISDQKPLTQKFCCKFTSKEDFESFKAEFEKACEHNAKILSEGKEKEEKTEAKVEDKKQETKEEAK